MKWNKSKDSIALMVGHGTSLNGSWDPGCTYGKYTEAGLMLPIVQYAVKWLRKSGVKVITDADTKNDKNMTATVALAERKRARLYMSVHCDYSGAPAGVAPLYKTAKDKKLAATVGKRVAKLMGMKYRGAFKRTDLYELNAPKAAEACCIFETGSIKGDLKKLRDSKKYGKALAKGILKYIGVPIWTSNRTKLYRKALQLVAYMNAHKFKYNHSYKACGTSWAQAKKTKRCNCHLLWNYSLQELGFLKPGQIFWINGTKVVCKGKGTAARVKKVFKITHPKKSPAKLSLKKGDICGYSDNAHTQGFAGQNKNKKPLWVSWGPSDVGKKQPRRRKPYDRKIIKTLMKLK